MPDDILTLIDRAITHQARPDALTCGQCGKFLSLSHASLDFCGQTCQEDWGIGRTAGYARDAGKGYLEHERWHDAVQRIGFRFQHMNGVAVPLPDWEQARLVQTWINEMLNS